MCGRFVVARPGAELVRELDPDRISNSLPQPSYNVAPTQQATIVVDSTKTDPPTRRVESARWGLVPGWATDLSAGARAINARTEDIESRRTFASALHARRAVIPASGFYEWQSVDGGKVPLFLHAADGAPLLFAGLYEWWRDPAKDPVDPARWVLSFTILTREAVGDMAGLHHRMPVLLDRDHADAWLEPSDGSPRGVLDAIVDDAPRLGASLSWHEVDPAVGNVRNDHPGLIESVRR